MNLGKENIRVAESIGSECLVCDKPIRSGEKIIELSFRLIVRVRKEVHVGCADRLCGLIQDTLKEAKK